MLTDILRDALVTIVIAIVAYLRGRASQRLVNEALFWMRVVEKGLAGQDNKTLENACVEMWKRYKGRVTGYAEDKFVQAVRKLAASQKRYVDVVRRLFGSGVI